SSSFLLHAASANVEMEWPRSAPPGHSIDYPQIVFAIYSGSTASIPAPSALAPLRLGKQDMVQHDWEAGRADRSVDFTRLKSDVNVVSGYRRRRRPSSFFE